MRTIEHRTGKLYNYSQKEYLSIIVEGFADTITRGMTSRGDLTEFLRITIDNARPSFREIINKFIPVDSIGECTDETYSKSWEAILRGMARMFPFHHDQNTPLGTGLAKSGFSEARLTGLLRSSGSPFFECVRRVSIHLASSGQRINWTEFADLILSAHPEKEAEIREKIAIDYYKFAGGEENRCE